MCILTSQHREKTYADFSNNDNRWQNMYEGKYLTVQALRPRLAILNLKKFILMYRLHAFKCQRPSCWMTTRSLPLLRRILTRDENWPGGHISRLNAIREYFINVQNWEQWSLKFIPGVILNSLVFFSNLWLHLSVENWPCWNLPQLRTLNCVWTGTCYASNFLK